MNDYVTANGNQGQFRLLGQNAVLPQVSLAPAQPVQAAALDDWSATWICVASVSESEDNTMPVFVSLQLAGTDEV